ncbi:MAG: peptidylprolyl isomerase [Armatimonadota bacterium]
MPEQYTPPTTREVTAAFAFGTQRATIKTQRGDIVIELYGDRVPLTVANFIKLAKAGLYKVSAFHRVVRNPQFWVIEAGDPEGAGAGTPDYTLKREIVPQLKHEPGAIAMARANVNDSAASQFYITLNHMPHLDGQHAVFGKVVKGLEVAQQIRQGDMIVDVIVEPVRY